MIREESFIKAWENRRLVGGAIKAAGVRRDYQDYADLFQDGVLIYAGMIEESPGQDVDKLAFKKILWHTFKLAMLGITQYDEIKFRGRQYSDGSYKNLKKYCLNYLYLQKCQTRAINHLRSLIELSFPELNSIFVHASSVMALQMFRMYAHPDFLVGLTVKNMVDRLYQIIGKHINRVLRFG